MNFYERLQLLCNKRGISVSSLCKTIGLNPTAGVTWKKHGTYPKIDTMNKIAEIFDIDVSWFYVDLNNFIAYIDERFNHKSEIKLERQSKRGIDYQGLVLDQEFVYLAQKMTPAQLQRVKDFMRGISDQGNNKA